MLGATLYREVRDFAPGTWTSGMLVVALMIADQANEKTRIAVIKRPLLRARTRLQEDGLRECLRRLSQSGYEFRRPIRKGRDGRILFAVPGRDPEYEVPLMAESGAFVIHVHGDGKPVEKPP